MTENATVAPANKLPALSAAPHSITLGGVEYPVRPMTFRDIGEYEAWAQDYYLERLERVWEKSKVDEEYKRERRRESVRVAERLSMNLDRLEDPAAFAEMDKITRSMEGITRLMWISLRSAAGTPALEDIARFMADDAVKTLSLAKFNAANGSGEVEADPKAGALMEAVNAAAMGAVTLSASPLSLSR